MSVERGARKRTLKAHKVVHFKWIIVLEVCTYAYALHKPLSRN
jgi:hypothetical protein